MFKRPSGKQQQQEQQKTGGTLRRREKELVCMGKGMGEDSRGVGDELEQGIGLICMQVPY